MAKLTYTRDQLKAFTVKELSTIDLYKEVKDPKKMSKTELVDAMYDIQEAAKPGADD